MSSVMQDHPAQSRQPPPEAGADQLPGEHPAEMHATHPDVVLSLLPGAHLSALYSMLPSGSALHAKCAALCLKKVQRSLRMGKGYGMGYGRPGLAQGRPGPRRGFFWGGGGGGRGLA